MMKAAGLVRGSRKKQQQQQQVAATQASARAQVVPAGKERSKAEPREQRPQQPQQIHPLQHQQQQPQAPTRPVDGDRPRSNSQEMQRRSSNHRPRDQIMAEHAALTQKNYRLAKELSELRVRHREESKNATRLTMENMNLASRCREAITHVAMLKKELAMHEQRAKEALALQRQQTQRIATNLSAEVSRLSHNSSSLSFESDPEVTPPRKMNADMERVLAMAPPPPPPRPVVAPPEVVKTVQTTLREKPQNQAENIEKEEKPQKKKFFADDDSTDEDETVEDSRNSRSILDIVESMSDLSSPPGGPSPSSEPSHRQNPKVYSTPNRNRREDRWTPSIDATPGSGEAQQKNTSLFPHSASPKGVGSIRHRNYNEEFPPDIMPHPNNQRVSVNLASTIQDPEYDVDEDGEAERSLSSYGSLSKRSDSQGSQQRTSGMITMNSIDAFEASFDTTFPTEFANREGETSGRSRTPKSTEIYNPFAPSPSRATPATPPTKVAYESKHDLSQESAQTNVTGSIGQYTTPPRKTRAPHPWSSDGQYQTPPKEESPQASPHVEPVRPHKTASAEARARYEKAMQPRNNAVPDGLNESNAASAPTNTIAAPPTTANLVMGSPSRLLKRIQQRRKTKEQHKLLNHAPPGDEKKEVDESPIPEATENHEPTMQKRMASHEGLIPAITQQGLPAIPPATSSNQAARPGARSEQPFDEMEEEPFDAPAREAAAGRVGSKSARLHALKNRRGIKQPVSYAEPPLNTKIRKGHDFFPRHAVNSESPQMVTPEHVAPTTAA